MSRLKILEYPDPRLRTRALAVPAVDETVRQLAADLLETMYEAPGIGLAATQVDVHLQVIVLDVSDAKDDPLVLINPELLSGEGRASGEEGCLSVPGYTDDIPRHERVRVRALGLDGRPFELEAEGLMAVCIQHEMDHLQGKLFIDYLSELKRERLRKRATKAARRDPPAPGRRTSVPVI
jgi:peptide deformylase